MVGEIKDMIVHLALFKFRPGISKISIDKLFDDLRKLNRKIEGVEHILAGENFSPHAENYTHAVVVVCHDKAALEAYRTHPEHAAIAKRIEHIEEKSLGADFEG